MLRGLAALRAVLSVVPASAIAGPILTLGEVGFKIWKRIALSSEYDSILIPPLDPNAMRMFIQLEPELSKHYKHLTLPHNWDESTARELEEVFNDFSFMTSPDLLRAKYPHVDPDYIEQVCSRNRSLLGETLDAIEQEIIKVSRDSEVDTNLRSALMAMRDVFPVLRDWALFNSEGFNDILEILDIVF